MNFQAVKKNKRTINDLERILGVNFFSGSDCLAIAKYQL